MWYSTPLQGLKEPWIIPLSSLKGGGEGVIYSYGQLPLPVIFRLQDLGLGKGKTFTVLFTFPSFLLMAGRERVALDQDLADAILVISLEEEKGDGPGIVWGKDYKGRIADGDD